MATVTLSRQHPFASPLGCVSALVVMLGIGIAILISGGAIFNPGSLSALAENSTPLGGFKSHAEFENDCAQCHTPFLGVDAARCENCHTDVAQQRAMATGLHSGFENAADCEACHTDHKGRDFDISKVALASFDHDTTGFSLMHHKEDFDGTPMACEACHTGSNFASSATACADCHGRRDAAFTVGHAATFGGDCTSCHDGTGSLANFDHNMVFVLDGKHAALGCAACHVDRKFKGTPKECVACHTEPAIHAGVFGIDCAACHTTTAWTPAALKNHTFPLDHGGQGEIACAVCHPNTYTDYTCYGCHEHDPARIQSEHAEEGIGGAELENCVECHATGMKEEGDN